MIKKLNLSDEEQVREKIFLGASKMAAMVGMTLGPHGRSVIIDRGTGEPLIVDDGRRVAEFVKFDDPIEQMAARTLYGVTRKTDEEVGDGTTTATVLSDGMIGEVRKNHLVAGGLVASTASVQDIDREILETRDIVLKKLDEMARPVKSEKDLIDVATASSGDPALGKIIGQMYYGLGKDGHIALEFNLLSEQIEHEVVRGLRFTGTYADRFMITNALRKESIFADSHVLVAHKKDIEPGSIQPLCAELAHAGKSSLVIIAPKFTADLIKSVYVTMKKTQNNFEVLCVRAPGLHPEHYEDIAIWTGGKFFSDRDDLATATKADLGYVERIEVNEDTAILIEGKGDKKAVEKRIEEVRADANLQKLSQFKQSRLDRISAMSGGVGVIRIGAATDEERNWLKHKIEDAKYATKAAFNGGVVPGGGQAFKKIAEELPEGNILKVALMAPYNRLKENAGGKLVVPKNVIDPVLVEKSAVKTACSAVSKLIRIGGAIANLPTPSLEEAFRGIMGSNSHGIEEDDDAG